MYENDVKFIKNMSFDDVDAIRKRLEKKREWPRDMRGSIRPKLVVISPYPGSSGSADQEYKKDSNPPWIKCVNGFFYEDSRKYWEKVRGLCKLFLTGKVNGDLNPDLLLLASHFNLYSSTKSIKKEHFGDFIVDYLNDKSINPDLIIFNGLKGFIKENADNINYIFNLKDKDKKLIANQIDHGFDYIFYEKNENRRYPIIVLPNSISKPQGMVDRIENQFLKICRSYVSGYKF